MRFASCSSSILIDAPQAPDGDVLDRVAYVVAETTIDLMVPIGFFDNSTLSIQLHGCMTGVGCHRETPLMTGREAKAQAQARIQVGSKLNHPSRAQSAHNAMMASKSHRPDHCFGHNLGMPEAKPELCRSELWSSKLLVGSM